jgi:hypothetical protein
VVRADPTLSTEQLSAAAGTLAAKLRASGTSALDSPAHEGADIVVAFADTAHDADLSDAAANARSGIVVFCRTSELGEPVPANPRITADIKAALELGWTVNRSTSEGTVLEKDGRLALFVYEATAVSPRDETVVDISRRLEGLGWRPIVTWNGAERSVGELEQLLAAHAIAAAPSSALRIIGEFDPHRLPPTDGPPKGSDGPTPGAGAPPETVAPHVAASTTYPSEGATDRRSCRSARTSSSATSRASGPAPILRARRWPEPKRIS